MKTAVSPVHGLPMLPGALANLPVFSQAGALLLDRPGANLFGGTLCLASIDVPNDAHVATTPALDGDDSVLVGGTGDDLVIAGAGHNLLVGGFGKTRHGSK